MYAVNNRTDYNITIGSNNKEYAEQVNKINKRGARETQPPPHEDTKRRQPSMNQDAGLHQTPNLRLPPWTSSSQDREEETPAVDKPPRLWYPVITA